MTTATRDRLLAGALAAVTVLVYLPSLQHGVVVYDEYGLDNPPVRAGLTASGVAALRWARRLRAEDHPMARPPSARPAA